MILHFFKGLLVGFGACTLLVFGWIVAASAKLGCCEWLLDPDRQAVLKGYAIVLYSVVPLIFAVASAIYWRRHEREGR
jgi:hypothetical protein